MNAAAGLSAASREKKNSLLPRIEKMKAIIDADSASSYIIWHDLEVERHAINKALPNSVAVYGSQDLEKREQAIVDFSDGKFQYLSAKPVIAGSGCNFQKHCHKAIFLGVGYKFNDFIQAIHRIYRFLQKEEVEIHIIYSEAEQDILRVLEDKWSKHKKLVKNMTEIIQKHGLNSLSISDILSRAIGCERVQADGKWFSLANNDCVLEAKRQPDNHVDLIVTSIPFSNHYEYTPSYNDFGHTDNNAHFWEQMDFLTPELCRILRPGRIYACHVKDRINFGNVTGAGIPTVSPFHCEAIMHGIKHGFDYMGMITVVTDVVRENNQTYRLGWTEQCKDGSKMGVGSPEYIILFHKPQTERSRGYADVPVKKEKSKYSRAHWQVDAHAFWRSSGNRILTPEDLENIGPDKMATLFTAYTMENIYDYELHIKIGETLEGKGKLPASFMSIAPGSYHHDVWTDINRMITLNSAQSHNRAMLHVCPLQFDIVDRLITRYSNEGELVYDPFCGLGTVPFRAVKLGRKGQGSELNTQYFLDSVQYLQAAEREVTMPSLFDVVEV
jgi:DNA modification methylase